LITRRGRRKSFQIHSASRIAMVAVMGFSRGKTILEKI